MLNFDLIPILSDTSAGASSGRSLRSVVAFRFSQLRLQTGIGWQAQIAIFFICAVAVISRRPDAFFHPQFFAEDGTIWYRDAYLHGWLHPLVWPNGGYLNTLQRLIADVALLFPFRFAPLVMNLLGMILQILPVSIMLSSGCAGWGSLALRLLYSMAYICLPNSSEPHITATNSQFHLALIAFLLATGTPARGLLRSVELAVFALTGVSGPFSFALLPAVLLLWWKRRQRWYLNVATTLAIFGAIQAYEIYSARWQRPPSHIGASLHRLVQIVGGRIYLGALLGGDLGVHLPFALIAVSAALLTAVLIFAACNANLELRAYLLFSYLLLAAALVRPLSPDSKAAWLVFIGGGSTRYWLLPMIAFVWAVIWCATQRVWLPIEIVSISAALMLPGAIVHDWRLPPFHDEGFQQAVARYEKARKGEVVTIPITPHGFTLYLPK